MTAALVLDWHRTGQLQLPLPGSGHTVQRWRRLAELTAIDVVAGRLAEAHADALAILTELNGPAPDEEGLWGVWAAEAPDAVVRARSAGDAIVLDGTKAWCSGAGLCTHALVTARLADGGGGLFAVDLRGDAVHPLESAWRNAGMARKRHPVRPIHRCSGDSRRAAGRLPDPARILVRCHRRRGLLAGWGPRGRCTAVPASRRRRCRRSPSRAPGRCRRGNRRGGVGARRGRRLRRRRPPQPFRLSGADRPAYPCDRRERRRRGACPNRSRPRSGTAVHRRTARSRCRGPHRVCPTEPRRA